MQMYGTLSTSWLVGAVKQAYLVTLCPEYVPTYTYLLDVSKHVDSAEEEDGYFQFNEHSESDIGWSKSVFKNVSVIGLKIFSFRNYLVIDLFTTDINMMILSSPNKFLLHLIGNVEMFLRTSSSAFEFPVSQLSTRQQKHFRDVKLETSSGTRQL